MTPPSVVAVAEAIEPVAEVAEVAENAEDAEDRVRPWTSPIVRTQVEAIREAGAPEAAPEAALEEAGTWAPGFTRMYSPDYLLGNVDVPSSIDSGKVVKFPNWTLAS